MKTHRLLLIAVLVTCGLLSVAQLPFRHYSTNEGLPSSETYSVFQDSKGYIWIATDMGVSRFDGYNFKNYSTADGLADNTIFKFYEDYKGRIWFHSFSGRLSYYYNDSIRGADMPINEQLRATLRNGYLTGIRCLANDTLLLGTFNGIIKVIPGNTDGTNTWVKIENLNNKNTYLFNDSSFATIEPQTATSIKLTTYINNTQSHESIVNDWYSHLINLVQNPDKSYVAIFSDSSFILNQNIQVTATVNLNTITTVLSENDSHIWLAGRKNGINLYHTSNYRTSVRHYLDRLTVSSVMRDRENGYWFTTTEDGIFYMPSKKFTWLIGNRDKMPDEKITSINAGPGGTWITAHYSLIVMKEDLQPVYKLLDRTGYPKEQTDIYYWNTFYYKPTEVWISTSSGVAIIDPVTEKLIQYINMLENEYGPEYDSRMLIADHGNNIWSLNLTTLRKIDAVTKKNNEIGKHTRPCSNCMRRF
ncbi:MAG TPA: two-component regulator propeller domain-containing protein [Chitinophagales bacterium]|nr:two-component regulator propeller domain-containing protein [Chitinophagales bacterium]